MNAIAGSAAIDADNMVKGTVYYDGITAVKSGKTAAEVKKAEQTPTEPSEPDVPVEPSTPPAAVCTRTVIRTGEQQW